MSDVRSHTLCPPRRDPPPCYANFCRLVSTPEEILIDFATVPDSVENARIAVRVAMQFGAARQLAEALQTAIERHEQLFGHLEPDPARRLVPGLHPPEQDWWLG